MTKHERNQYLLSVSAVAMSLLALLFAFLELRASEKQLDANVWPYVELGISISPDSAVINLANKGLGPASIQEFYIMLEGERVENLYTLLENRDVEETVGTSMSSVLGSVLAVGESMEAMRFFAADVGFAMLEKFQSMEIIVCHCSINNRCWTDNNKNIRSHTPVEECLPNDHALLEDLVLILQDQEIASLETESEQ